MDLAPLTHLAAGVGFPAALLLMLAWGGLRAARWAGPNVVLPLVQRALRFVDAVEAHVTEATAAVQELRQEVRTACRFQPPNGEAPHEAPARK